MLTIKELVCAFFVGAFGYGLVEILFRGFTHWSMLITGGIVFCLFYKIYITNNLNLVMSCLVSMLIITLIELFVGFIVNIELRMHVWDYSNVALNLRGQICVPFSICWFFMGLPMVFLSRTIRGIR